MNSRHDLPASRTTSAVVALLAAMATSTAAPAAPAGGDAVMGGKLFLQCRACHTVAAGEPSTVGPNLNGVVGAKAASHAGYGYSPALAAAGIVWTPATLDTWLQRPSAMVPGTKMIFAGVPSAKSRQDIIAYLATLKKK